MSDIIRYMRNVGSSQNSFIYVKIHMSFRTITYVNNSRDCPIIFQSTVKLLVASGMGFAS